MRADEEIHIAGYIPSKGGPPTRIYGYGPGDDAEPPVPKTKSGRAKRKRLTVSSDSVPSIQIPHLPGPDRLTAALMGIN